MVGLVVTDWSEEIRLWSNMKLWRAEIGFFKSVGLKLVLSIQFGFKLELG